MQVWAVTQQGIPPMRNLCQLFKIQPARCACWLGLVLLASTTSSVFAQDVRYPRVYGFTGRPYGPTQAHYQYQKQYGRPWHGYGGERLRQDGVQFTQTTAAGAVLGGYGYSRSGFGCGGIGLGGLSYRRVGFGYGYGNWGWPYAGGYSSVFAPQSYGYYNVGPAYQFHTGPTVIYPGAVPIWDPVLTSSPALDPFRQEEIERWQTPVDLTPVKTVRREIPASNAAARAKSLEAQSTGDAAFRRQDFHHAVSRYRQAITAAGDQGGPHFRMGFALIALNHFDKAGEYFRLGLVRDPSWPTNGQSVRTLYGPDNEIAREVHLRNVTRWVKEDIRDPHRLFVLGVLLHFDDKQEEAGICFETALRLAGGGEHLKAFLRPAVAQAAPANDAANSQAPEAGGPVIDPPQSVEPGLIPPPPAPASPDSAQP